MASHFSSIDKNPVDGKPSIVMQDTIRLMKKKDGKRVKERKKDRTARSEEKSN